MKSVLVTLTGFALAFSASAFGVQIKANTTQYNCKEDSSKTRTATLVFSGSEKLQSVELTNIPMKTVPKKLFFSGSGGEYRTGRNSEDEYGYYEWLRTYGNDNWSFELSYKTKHLSKKLSLDDSLVGSFEATDGSKYGKLRVDVTLPDMDNQYGNGISLFYSCTRN